MSEFNKHGGYFAPAGYMKVESGGTHEENPNGGVQIGVDPQGVPNMLEQNEPVYNDFVFSDNIVVTKEMAEAHKLPKQIIGKFYSDAVQYFMDEAEERAFDPASRNGLEAMLGRLADAQEEQKQMDDMQKFIEEMGDMSPGELDAIAGMMANRAAPEEQMMPEMQQPGMMAPEQAMMAEQIPQEQVAPEDAMMMQQTQEQPMMRRGGPMNTFTGGGGVVQDGMRQNGDVAPAVHTEYLPPINTELGRRYAMNMAARVASGDMALKDVPSKYYSYVQGEVQGAQPTRDAINNEGVKTALGTVALPAAVIGAAEAAGAAAPWLANPANQFAAGKTLAPLLTGAAIDEGVSSYTPYENVGDMVYRGSGLQGLLHRYVPESSQPAVDTFGEMLGEGLNPGWYTGGLYGNAAKRIAGAGLGRSAARPVTAEAVASSAEAPAAEAPAAETSVAESASNSGISSRASRRSSRIERRASRSARSSERVAEYDKKTEAASKKKDELKKDVKDAKEKLSEKKDLRSKAKQEVAEARDDIRAGANLKYGSTPENASDAGTADELLGGAKERYSKALDARTQARRDVWDARGDLLKARGARVGNSVPRVANTLFNPYNTYDYLHNGRGWRAGWAALPAASQLGAEANLLWGGYKGLTANRPEKVSKESLSAGDFIEDSVYPDGGGYANYERCGGKINRYDGTTFGQSGQLNLLPNKTYAWQKPIPQFAASTVSPSFKINNSGPLFDIDTDKTPPIAETGWRPKDNTLLGYEMPSFDAPLFSGVASGTQRSTTPWFTTAGKWAAPGLSLAQALWNAGRDGDRYNLAKMPVNNLGVQMHLQNPRYRPVDVNQAENRNTAQENAMISAIRNSGVGASAPAAFIAADYRAGQNRGNGFNTIRDYNNTAYNQALSGANQNAASLAQLDYNVAKAREDAALQAAKVDIQNDLIRQRYENMSDQDYANAFINSSRDVANFLYNEAISNRNLNQANARRDLYDYVFPSGTSIYRGAPSARQSYYTDNRPYWQVGDGGFIKKIK